MNRQHHSGNGNNIQVGDVFGGLHVHPPRADPPRPPLQPSPHDYPDTTPPPALAIVLSVVFVLVVCGGGLYAAKSGWAGGWENRDPSAPSSSPAPPSATRASAAPTTRAAATYPVRIKYEHWHDFVPGSVTLRPGDSLKFTNESGRSCHLIAASDYLPPGTGRNPVPNGGSYVVRFAEPKLQGVACEGASAKLIVSVHE